jgi:uncharacterized protein (TIGR02444 family)
VSKSESLLWSFSLAVYSDGSVQQECLNLQDQYGIDVNVLLFCAYAGVIHGAIMPESALREALDIVAEWNDKVVSGLRMSRRALNPFAIDQMSNGPSVPSAAALRNSVKAAELEAERIEQATLEKWSAAHLTAWQSGEPGAAAAANIRGLFTICCRSGSPPRPDRLIAAATRVAQSLRGKAIR